MKRFVSVFLTALILLGTLCTGSFAVDNEETLATAGYNDFIASEPDYGEVSFSVPYAEAGREIKAVIEGYDSGELFYKWFIDNVQINDFTDSYVPSEGDYEKMLTVKIYDADCELIGEKSMFISPLPVVYIEVEDRQPIVSKDKQLDAYMVIQGNSEYSDSSVLYDGKTQIKGRGNTTWDAQKKPYKLKLDSKADLFGMGKNKHWVLLSNPYDNSNMRNDVSYKAADDMGLQNQSCVWVDLVLNGKSVGLYQLCEHVRVDDGRVEITDWDGIAEDAAKAIYKKNTDIMTKDERDELIDIMTDDMNWVTRDTVTYKGNTFTVSDYYEVPSINGGYLIEVDWHETALNFKTPSNANVAISKPEGIGTDMFNYIKDYYIAFETALFADDFCTEYDGKTMRYTDFIDVESFAKGVLLNEIFENYDFGLNSTYISKDIDGKLVFGPVWDMDYTVVSSFNNWTTARKAWIKRMLSDPVFMQEFRKIYFEYRYTAFADVVREGGDIDTAIEKIAVPSAHDDKIWKNSIPSKENALDFKWRFQTKMNWLDQQLLTLDSTINSVNSKTAAINSSDISLSLSGDTLDIGFAAVPAEAKIFADGVLYKEIEAPEAEMSIALEPADSDAVYTVISYDGDGKVLRGNYISGERYVQSLTVTVKPEKMTYNAGEALDLTGLELTAAYSDGTTEAVVPDAVYTYTKDALGTQFFCYDRVTDKIGSVYAVFMYENARTELKLTVSPRENSDEVAQMISAIPAECSDPMFTKCYFEAKVAYDALSSAAKGRVANADALTAAQKALSTYVSDPEISVFDCYSDGAMRNDAKDNVVVVSRFAPRRVVFEYSAGGTASYARDTVSVISIKTVGSYELWTINHKFSASSDSYIMRAAYPGTPAVKSKQISTDYIFNSLKPIKKVSCPNYAYCGETFTLGAEFSSGISEIGLSENGEIIDAECADTENGQTLSFAFDTPGKHTVTLSYLKDGIRFDYASYDIYVREPVEKGREFAAEYTEFDYNAKTQIKKITDASVKNVSLVSDDETVELEGVEKNGFVIWTGEVDTGKDYAVSVDGTVTGENISTVRIGDVNLDGMINSYDALLVLQFSTEQKIPDEGEAVRADLDFDGEHTSYDALVILKIATGKI